MDFGFIGFGIQFAACQDQVKINLFFPADLFKSLDCHFDAAVQIENCNVQQKPVGTVFVQFQQILGELFQTFGFKNNNVQVFFSEIPGGMVPSLMAWAYPLMECQGKSGNLGDIRYKFR